MNRELLIFRVLMLLYPAGFRRRYGSELEAAFLAIWREARYARAAGALFFWRDIALDLIVSASRQRLRQAATFARRVSRPSERPSNKVDVMLHDVRHALRLALRQPAFSAAAILSLALGIGGSSLIYGLVDALVLRPFPYPDPDSLVAVGVTFPSRNEEQRFIEAVSPAVR
jgi:hypothetical protein